MYPVGERIDWTGVDDIQIMSVAVQEVWPKLKRWEQGWLMGDRYATSKKGQYAIEGYLRHRVRKLMEGK